MNTLLRRLVCSLILVLVGTSAFASSQRDQSFDADWRFLRADAPGAENPAFDDSTWRVLDLPHDWSIEDLPSTNGVPPSPFDPVLSAGGPATGFFVGGTGWYRKHFTLPTAQAGKNVTICFDGVYMNADVWLNGRHLGNHPYGYTGFEGGIILANEVYDDKGKLTMKSETKEINPSFPHSITVQGYPLRQMNLNQGQPKK